MPRAPHHVEEKKEHKPQKHIDWDQVDDDLKHGCNGVQIAAFIGVSTHTLYDRCYLEKGVRFSEYSQEKRAVGDRMLHKKQYEEALGLATVKGNTQLLLRLGETRLDQCKDAKEVNINLRNLSDLPKAIKDGTLDALMTQDEVIENPESDSDASS